LFEEIRVDFAVDGAAIEMKAARSCFVVASAGIHQCAMPSEELILTRNER